MATVIETTARLAAQMAPMAPAACRVQRLRRETHDTFTLELRPPDSEGWPFAAGQFDMLYVFGVGEVPISISGDPARPLAIVHTIRAVGAVTRAMRELKSGDLLGIRGPFGTHWPVAEAAGSDIIIVAGGIGLAPLRPALYEILARRERYGKIVLLYGARTPSDILFRRELQQWHSRSDLEVHVTVDRADHAWKGNVGVVTPLIRKATFDAPNTVAIVCGPEIMMRFAVAELQRRGVGLDGIYLSMERNMKCGVGFCGHCQYGPVFVCKDGPIFPFKRIMSLFATWEI